ncbi:MAG: 5'-nucleotidase C-terminal domain-containing protein [Pseudobdellovibrionaceae bacterium]
MKQSFAFLFVFLISIFAFSFEAGKNYHLTFYHINDSHGAFYKRPQTNDGGFAILSTIVKQAKKEADQTKSLFFLTSGGDVNTGTPESDLLLAEPDFRSMHLIGFDAMVVGNHEFDHPWKTLFTQQSWAQFPFLGANVKTLFKENLPLVPYIIKEDHGLKVAFLGLTTEHIPFLTLPHNIQGLTFEPAISTAKKWIPFLKQHADIVVVLSHLGWCSMGDCTAPNDYLLAQQVSGIDLILGGHSHTPFSQAELVNGTYIFQAFEKTLKVGVLNMEFKDGKLSLINSELKSINGVEDPEILAVLDPLIQSVSNKLKVVIGETSVYLDGERSNIRYKETTLGNLITKTLRELTDSDIALYNSGGIRASIPVGPITVGDIFKVLPFGNSVCTVELNGSELLQYMGSVITLKPGEGGFPQISGVTLKIGTENKISELKVNGQLLEPTKIYKLALNDFMAQGQDSYPKVSDKGTYRCTGLSADKTLSTFIEKHKIIHPKDVEVTGYFQK